MAYTTIKKPSDYFNTKLYNGTGSSNAVTGVGFQPDFTWIKRRNSATAHHLHNAISGATKVLNSNTTNAESTDAQKLSSFDSDGFTVGTNGDANNSAGTFASWNWLGANGTAANTDGSISSTVSANTTSGFSIVSYTGTQANATVGHGLGSAPSLIILKNRTSPKQWQILHHKNTSAPATQQLEFGTDATATVTSQWNSIMPTSSVFSIGTNNATNESGQSIIAYCFAEKQGYSKFGSYTGNGNADGTFVYTGFKPAFIIVKPTSGTEHWTMFDNKRLGYNPDNNQLYPNLNSPDATADELDILSNGFKIRSTTGRLNTSGVSHIYITFAEEPLVGDNPCTAR